MKKVLCLIDSLGSGGAQRQLVGLAGLLQQKGYDVTLACYYERVFYREHIERNHINLVKLTPKNNKLSKYIEVFSLIRRERYDAVIAYLSGPEVIVSMARLFLRHKFVAIVSERNVVNRMTLVDKMRYCIYSLADYVVSNSHTQNSILHRRFQFLRKKALTINNFVDTQYFTPADVASDGDSVLKILVLARINMQKNVLGLIEAARKLKDRGIKFRIDWYGDYKDADYHDRCVEKIRALDVGDLFCLHSATTDVLSKYRECDVFCLPSFFEGCPNVVAEAMSCGKPVLCSNVCDNPLIVEDGGNGFLFAPNDIDGMASSIARFSELPVGDRVRFGKRSRELAVEKFSSDAFVDKYIKLIESK